MVGLAQTLQVIGTLLIAVWLTWWMQQGDD